MILNIEISVKGKSNYIESIIIVRMLDGNSVVMQKVLNVLFYGRIAVE